MIEKPLALSIAATLCHGVFAQPPLGIKPLDALVAALNAKSMAPLQPYLTSQTRIGSLPAAYTTQVLSRVLEKARPVEASKVVRQQAEGANTRYFLRLTRGGRTEEKDFLLSPEGKFLEINLVKAEVQRISTAVDSAKAKFPNRMTVPFRLKNGLILVAAVVDGRRGDFVLDTGSPGLFLNKAHFGSPTGRTSAGSEGARGVNGAVSGASYHHLRRFDWGGITLGEQDVATFDLSGIEKEMGKRPVLGLIGYSLLRRYALTIDYQAHELRLTTPVGRSTGAGTFPLAMHGHLPVAQFAIGKKVFALGVDTGAQTDLLDAKYESGFKGLLRKRQSTGVVGADGRRVVLSKGTLPEIRIGRAVRFSNQATVFSSVAAFSGKAGTLKVDGLAGYPLLSRYRTTIDYVNKTIRFDPR